MHATRSLAGCYSCMATKFAPLADEAVDDNAIDLDEGQSYRLAMVTIRFLGTSFPVMTLGIVLAYTMS